MSKTKDPIKDVPDNELREDIKLPPMLAVAFTAERPELCIWKGPMKAEEAEAVVHAFQQVLKKNEDLRKKLALYRKISEDGLSNLDGQLRATAQKLVELDADASRSTHAVATKRGDDE